MRYNRKLLNIPLFGETLILDPVFGDAVVLKGRKFHYLDHVEGIKPFKDQKKKYLLTDEAYGEFRRALNALENDFKGASEIMRALMREIDDKIDI